MPESRLKDHPKAEAGTKPKAVDRPQIRTKPERPPSQVTWRGAPNLPFLRPREG